MNLNTNRHHRYLLQISRSITVTHGQHIRANEYLFQRKKLMFLTPFKLQTRDAGAAKAPK